ncbi:MAG TPA: ABC transporter permease [Stellaceae bacterium]|nr:ABC transporter permease [Stellaceae bacterium]
MARRILFLIVKELLAVWRDPRSRMILIVPPVVQLIVFAFAMTQEVTSVRMAVLNQDLGTESRDLVARFAGSPYVASVRALRGTQEIRPALDSADDIMVLVIPQDFSRDLAAGRPATVQALLDGRRSNAAQIVEGYAERIVAQFNADRAAEHDLPHPASVLVGRAWFNPNLTARWATVPGLLGTLTMLLGMVVTALSVARERELGTFEQLLVSPLAPVEILIGKAVPAFLIGIGEASLILAIAVFVLEVPFVGALGLLYAGMAVYLAAVIGVGLFISSLVATQQQAILGAFTFFAPAILLSGFITPVENMPDWLQPITLVDPMRFFTVIARGVFLKAMPASEVAQNLWPMAVIAVVTLSAAAWLFGRRLR